MLTETGRIVAVEKDWVWVETIRQSTCGSCSAAKGCGHGLMNQVSDGRRSYLKVSVGGFPGQAFTVGDEVRIAIPEQLMLSGSFMMYMVPLFSTLALAAGCSALVDNASDLHTLTGAAAGFGVGVLLVRLHAWYRQDDPALTPKLLGPAAQQPQVGAI